MSIERDLYEVLTAEDDLKRLLNGRIFPVRIPQNTKLPAMVYHRISAVPYHTLDGYGLSRVRIRLDIWALDYSGAKEISAALIAALVKPSGFEKMIENCAPDWADDNVFRTSVDIVCWEKEGNIYG